jgi:hypothetical protein
MEPYEVTRRSYIAYNVVTKTKELSRPGVPALQHWLAENTLSTKHRFSVMFAIAAGKPVAEEVLADYDDLEYRGHLAGLA